MEVCVDSVESAYRAELGGASRVELCANLMEGGTTPSLGMLKVIKEHVKIPVFCMLRPRGGDFLYTEEEMKVMIWDLNVLKEHGADGFVIGALTSGGSVDKEACKKLIDLAGQLPITFHRAIDMCCDWRQALEDIISLGCHRVLTSGQDSSALEGLPTIKQMIQQSRGRITVMPAGGINERNVKRILEGCGAKEFHASARSLCQSSMLYKNSSVAMGASLSPDEFSHKVTDDKKVMNLVTIAMQVSSS